MPPEIDPTCCRGDLFVTPYPGHRQCECCPHRIGCVEYPYDINYELRRTNRR